MRYMSARILVAEDDPKQSHVIKAYLEKEGHSVLVVGNGRQALEFARARKPDLIVLDIMMPEVDGLDVCRVLRAESQVLILLLTARATESHLLLGLDLGADDYMVKPYNPRELTARIRALLRRGTAVPVNEPIRALDVEIDTRRFEVRVAGDQVALTAKEFELLRVLASEPGRVFTRTELLEHVFGFDHQIQTRTVNMHVSNLRRKIEPNPEEPVYVLTVPGRGYKFAG